jgi:D-alanyl-D-alanine carboxypeptidase/D-alanyl-D-alanine endopeptidase (penicillin-binding protein 7)
MLKNILATLLLSYAAAAAALPFGSQAALVVEEDTGKVLLEKNADNVAPIASLTKLMTAMVVLDSKPDMDEIISIEPTDVDTIKHSSSRVPVGAELPRKDVLQLALMSSDNRAAAALARTYPGGTEAFMAAVQAKLAALGMTHTTIQEPTGLSPSNTSTAADLVKMAEAASTYPDITRITTSKQDIINIKGRPVTYHNTNPFVGKQGWDIMLSKTGFTNEAGRCLIMKLQSAEKSVIMVLLNARANSVRAHDAVNIHRVVFNDEPPIDYVAPRAHVRRVSYSTAKHRRRHHRAHHGKKVAT